MTINVSSRFLTASLKIKQTLKQRGNQVISHKLHRNAKNMTCTTLRNMETPLHLERIRMISRLDRQSGRRDTEAQTVKRLVFSRGFSHSLDSAMWKVNGFTQRSAACLFNFSRLIRRPQSQISCWQESQLIRFSENRNERDEKICSSQLRLK